MIGIIRIIRTVGSIRGPVTLFQIQPNRHIPILVRAIVVYHLTRGVMGQRRTIIPILKVPMNDILDEMCQSWTSIQVRNNRVAPVLTEGFFLR